MAILSGDGTCVTVQKGDTLGQIAVDYAGGYSKYKTLAAINNISNPNLIYVGQIIKLTADGSGTTSTTTSSNQATVDQFGQLSTDENTLFATWSWSKANTESYKVIWYYDPGNGIWFVGSNSTISVDKDEPDASRQSTYSIPSNAKKVKFKVKPISEKQTKNGKETSYWEANWSTEHTWTDSTPLVTPGVPSVKIEKYKLTATLENVHESIAGVQFQVVKDNSSGVFATGKAVVVSQYVSYSCTVDAGGEYKVRCRAYTDSGDYSEWTDYSNNEGTIPATPTGITTIRATSETSVYLEWEACTTAKTYDIEYTTKKQYFDGSNQTTTISAGEFTHFEITGMESGEEYFFRIRAVNEDGESGWSDIVSVTVGKKPSAPTTWSSTTTCITGDALTLYWVHNSEDGSSQTYADLEIYVDGHKESYMIKNTEDEDEKDKTSFYILDTSMYIEGTKIEWRVRTSGVTKEYGDWSVQRTVDIYAPPTIEMKLLDGDGAVIDTLRSFPFYIYALAGPATQIPISYHLSITANTGYETVDSIGNSITINEGGEVYSKYFDTADALMVEFSAGNIDLENNIEYTATCTVAMNSGLTAKGSSIFTVAWNEVSYEPNAEIGIDPDSLVAYIRPYCDDRKLVRYQVTLNSGKYVKTSTVLDFVYGEIVPGTTTTTGEKVYSGVTADDRDVYFCEVEEITDVENVLLSVYRREYNGGFVELAVDLDGAQKTTITDPHPALDYARYRIVAKSKDTGALTYYDPPGYPVGGNAIVIQWNEDWSSFETSEEGAMEKPTWAGSILKLPYNVDISDSTKADVSLVRYIGRTHPVTYYGTQIEVGSTWNTEILATDKETLYGIRRLSMWNGDVYVREPSGSGYWANISVSYNQKHLGVSIPVTFNITRVEGGA